MSLRDPDASLGMIGVESDLAPTPGDRAGIRIVIELGALALVWPALLVKVFVDRDHPRSAPRWHRVHVDDSRVSQDPVLLDLLAPVDPSEEDIKKPSSRRKQDENDELGDHLGLAQG